MYHDTYVFQTTGLSNVSIRLSEHSTMIQTASFSNVGKRSLQIQSPLLMKGRYLYIYFPLNGHPRLVSIVIKRKGFIFLSGSFSYLGQRNISKENPNDIAEDSQSCMLRLALSIENLLTCIL